MRNKLIVLNIIIIPLIAGCGFLIKKESVSGDSQKYYIGSANTMNYQTVIKDILLEYGYYTNLLNGEVFKFDGKIQETNEEKEKEDK